MKRLLKFFKRRFWYNWRAAQGLPPFPSLPGSNEVWHQCVICGRKERLWEEPFISVLGTIEDGFFWLPSQPRVGIPFSRVSSVYTDSRVRVICRDHGGKKGMTVIDSNTGWEVVILPYQKRVRVYRLFRDITWQVKVIRCFVQYSIAEMASLVFFPCRYIYWARTLGQW